MAEGLIGETIAFIEANRAWAGPIVGLLTFGESLAFVGLLMPATALMIATGSMIGMGVLEPLPVTLWAIAGAVLGDWLSFALGRKIGPDAYRRWPLKEHRHAVARTRLFFRRHGLAVIFVGRFLGPIRSTVPLVAGVLGMKQRTFQLANISSAILWVPVLFAPGFLAARSLGPLEEVSEAHLLGLGLIVMLLTFGGSLTAARLTRRSSRGRARHQPTPPPL
jgi:membrane protein DedA with SNARE-associated domain